MATADPDRSDTLTEGSSVPKPKRRLAAHVTADNGAFIDLCENVLDPEGLHHVAAYHRGVFNYSVDILDRPHVAAFVPGDTDTEASRNLYIRVGRQLNFLLGRMDRSLRPVESGRLIRTVLRLDDASVFHYYVRPGEYLTGVSLGRRTADAGDRAMTRLATGFRDRLRQLRIDYGGFMDADEKLEVQDPPDRTTIPRQSSPEEAFHADQFGDLGPSAQRIRRLCVSSLLPEDLHYVAYVDPASGFLSVDLLGDPDLTDYFSVITRQQRRDRYQDIARRLHFVVARLDHSLKAVLPGRLTRTVLDVDEGALYYCAVGNGSFLLGVTLHQDRVSHADHRMTMLTNSIQQVVKAKDSDGH